MSYGSPVVLFLDRRHPYFCSFYSIISVDVVRVKSDVIRLFDPAFVPMTITINEHDFVPKQAAHRIDLTFSNATNNLSSISKLYENLQGEAEPRYLQD